MLRFLVLLISFFTFTNAQNINKDGLLNEFKQITSYSPQKGDLFKAMLYEHGYPEQNIDANLSKSIMYYKKAFDKKSPIAAFKLGMIEWQKEQYTKKVTYKPLKYFLKAKNFEPQDQAILNIIAAGIYLFHNKHYKRTIRALQEPVKHSHSTAEFYTALAFRKLGDISQANYFLTRACTNKIQNKDIKAYCNDMQSVEKIDIRDDNLNKVLGLDDEKSCTSCNIK